MITMLPMLAVGAACCWGSVLAFRGRKWWATWCMLLGSIGILLGPLVLVLGQVILFRTAWSGSGGSPSPSSVAAGMDPFMVVMIAGSIVSASSMITFAIGFVGFCARSGAAERRAAELETMVGQIQARLREKP
ncbi:MAG: hypothetical protein HKN82_02595 [Akkermansiaceae bacterium]|nr:hypothetical protein [Akkermansiaceae bacterium]